MVLPLKFFMKNKLELSVFLIITILMFSNLSNMHLWNDEAETALLAKNTLLYGVPKVYDGKNLVSNNGKDFNSDFIWTWSSWLHLYIAALSFSIFGLSTFGARLLFVVVGILSFFPIIALFRKLSINRLHYRLCVLSLLFFVPYYLYSRQSRYFALLIFLMPIIATSIYNLLFKNGPILWFVVSSVLLFHSNYLSFFIVMLSASIYFFIIIPKRAKRTELLKKLILSYALIFLFTFPWALYANIFEKIDAKSSLAKLVTLKIYYILHDINYTAPLLLLLCSVFAMLYLFKKNEQIENQKILFCFFSGVVPIIILIFPIYNSVRYLIGLFPLWILFILLAVVFLLESKSYAIKVLGAVIFLLFIFTNFFYAASFYFFAPFENFLNEKCSALSPEKSSYCSSWVKDTFINPRKLEYPFFYYLYEVTHDYDGPIEGIVKYLNSNGNKNSIVFTYNWYFSIPFYTDMEVLSPLRYEDSNLTPDFIVLNLPNRRDNEKIDYLISYAESRNYKKIILQYPDLPWDNRPELWYHKYWSQPIEVPVTIYAKQSR